ncbi:MAG: hypothetical protein K6F51_14915 [Acetatifactor sp.]|nr:hypothetical protein [Acetatifactor sp.]
MNKTKKILLTILPLVLILSYAFLVRARAYLLPATEPEEKQYMQDENGEPYLTEMDSYYYLRKTAEMAEAGKVTLFDYRSDDLKIGQRLRKVAHSSFMPEGFPSLAYLLWRYVFSLFGVTLVQVAIWMGPVLSGLAAVPAFLYVRSRVGLMGGVAAGVLAGCAIPFVVHTHAGFYDTDMFLGVLPLTYLLSQLKCMQEEKLKRQFLFAFFSALGMTGMYCVWGASRTYFLLALVCAILPSLIVLLLPSKFLPEHPWLRKFKVFRGALLSHLFSVVLLFFVDGSEAMDRLLNAFGTIRFATGVSSAAMPNAFQYTGEMMKIRKIAGWSPLKLYLANTKSLLGMLGGALPCFLAGVMIPLTILLLVFPLKRSEEEARQRKESVVPTVVEVTFFLPWLFFSLKYAFTGVRYAEIAVLPISVMGGLLLGRLTKCIRFKKKVFQKCFLAACIFLSILTVFPAALGAWTSSGQSPSLISDGRAQAMKYLRENTPQDTAVAGWWDDGYYVQFAGQRRSLSDGGTSSGRANWFLGRALMTDDPKLSAGIFRMINESNLDVLYALMNGGMDETDAIALLLQILPMEREEAAGVLKAANVDESLLDETHPLDSNTVALTLSTDLMGKIDAITYYGFWDPKEGRVTEDVSYRISKSSVALDEEGKADLEMIGSGIVLHVTEDSQGHVSADYHDASGKLYELGRICVWQDGVKLQDERIQTEDSKPSVVLVKEGNRYCGVICTDNLADSMLLRLLLCEDKSVSNLRYLGTWYGNAEKEPCEAQRRIDPSRHTAWATQLWLYE